jgi:nicotinamidase-related amidase
LISGGFPQEIIFMNFKWIGKKIMGYNNSAIIVVDMLNDFIKPTGSLYVKNSEKIIEPIKNILNTARIVGAQVVYVCDSHEENDPEFKDWPKHCVKGTWGAEIIDELMPKRQGGGKGFIANDQKVPDLVIKKNQLSAMTSFHFRTWLDEWTYLTGKTASQCIYIVGVATEYCIKSLALDLSVLGPYTEGILGRTNIISDCIEGVNLKNGDVTLAIADISKYTSFMSSDELIKINLVAKNIDINLAKEIYEI